MKRSSPLWGSVSVLIGVVIAILALVRGAWLVPLLLLVFTAWGLWVVMFQLQPAWDSIRGYRKKEHDARKQREASLYSTAQANADAIRLLNEAMPNDKVLALRSLEALAKVANGKATKIIIPSELQNLGGVVPSIKELMTDPKDAE